VKVVLHPADENGCGYYRMSLPGHALAEQGYDVTVDHDANYRGVWRTTIRGEVLVNLDQKITADVIVIQRPLHRNRFELIQILQSKGVAVVVEVDDDFHAVHKRNAAWHGTSPLHHPDHHRDWLTRSCEIADLVTVTTPALAERYGGHGRVAVLPNCVPKSYLALSGPTRDVPVVGWSGSVDTHPGDLEATQGALSGFQIKVVGTGKGVKKALGLKHEPPVTGWLPLTDYPKALATLDVGVVPLAMTPFNEAKSYLKGLEFAALGVPFVASPTGPYQELHRMGAGLLAVTPQGWKDQVGRLVANTQYRAELAEAGMRVAERLTIEENASRWWQAYQWAVMQRKQAA
jgi:glycosyltransferase involved in cell wall biosynthesis